MAEEEEGGGGGNASIGAILSNIFTGSPENERSDAIQNQEIEELGEEMEASSLHAI